MADPEREDSYYYPSGVPITPQARQLGYEFPVYVSPTVWAQCCVTGGIPQARMTYVDKRISELLVYCYEGMIKSLAVTDDFVMYFFKVWYWHRERPASKKKKRARLAARLFLDPSTDTPWMYIFLPNVDSICDLESGEAPLGDLAETIPLFCDENSDEHESPAQQNEDLESEQTPVKNTIDPDNLSETVEDDFLDQLPDQFYKDPAT